ncbi:hypothetical protein [Methylobacterium sp. MA0201]|uniref:hypothetical protein n=1 Tax=Methylobacterium alsaeris TaxID=3344826 RepID=UPI0037574B85
MPEDGGAPAEPEAAAAAPAVAAAPARPPEPTRLGGPDKATWAHRDLYDRVFDALHALPSRFRTSLRIAGISATDLFTLNTPLGAAIEQSVVESLNDLRELWDPNQEYQLYSFVRQAQVFPDVRLQTTAPGVANADRVLMGIELKGWFVLAKEGEPSFRYKAAPMACAPQDLLVVYPWTLDEVLSGTPKLLRPFVEEARYAAEQRNYYWENMRTTKGPQAGVKPAPHQAPYPNKGDKFNDEPVSDQGKNFGRVARSRIMDDFITALMLQPLSGIPARYWQAFLKIFAEGNQGDNIERALATLRAQAEGSGDAGLKLDALDKIAEGLLDLTERL